MEIVFIKRECPEWDYMWNTLEKHPINEGIPEPSLSYNKDEFWMYMGTLTDGVRYLHEFTHRSHPKTDLPYTFKFDSSELFNPKEDIIKRIKVK